MVNTHTNNSPSSGVFWKELANLAWAYAFILYTPCFILYTGARQPRVGLRLSTLYGHALYFTQELANLEWAYAFLLYTSCFILIQELANLAWAFVTARHPAPELLRRVGDVACARAQVQNIGYKV